MGDDYFRIKSGTVLHLPYAGVVLRFRRSENCNDLTAWRTEPTHNFGNENTGIDDKGKEIHHGVALAECPLPGPRATEPKETQCEPRP